MGWTGNSWALSLMPTSKHGTRGLVHIFFIFFQKCIFVFWPSFWFIAFRCELIVFVYYVEIFMIVLGLVFGTLRTVLTISLFNDENIQLHCFSAFSVKRVPELEAAIPPLKLMDVLAKKHKEKWERHISGSGSMTGKRVWINSKVQ